MKFILILLAIIVLWYVAQQFMSSGKAQENMMQGQAFLEKKQLE